MIINTYEQFIEKMNEGLIKTYDILSVERVLGRHLKSINLSYKLNYREHGCFDLQLIPKNRKNKIIEEFDLDVVLRFTYCCGYFPSYVELTYLDGKIEEEKFDYTECTKKIATNQISEMNMMLESKFDNLLNPIPNVLYHVCKDDVITKIMKNGLVPKSKHKLSTHPDRIYFTTTIEDAEFVLKKFNIIEEDNYTILDINTKKCKDIKLYLDPNFQDGGVYTYDNIHPSAIKIHED